MNSNPGGVAQRESSPYTGKCPARPAGKPRIISPKGICDDSFVTTRFPQLSKNYNYRAPNMRFSRDGGIYHPGVVFNLKTKPWGGAVPPPAGRPRAQVKERAGRIAPSSPFVMSSGRLILDRVGRHQSPSPLHRHTQINMMFSKPQAKGDISTLPGRGHFYFALTDW